MRGGQKGVEAVQVDVMRRLLDSGRKLGGAWRAQSRLELLTEAVQRRWWRAVVLVSAAAQPRHLVEICRVSV